MISAKAPSDRKAPRRNGAASRGIGVETPRMRAHEELRLAVELSPCAMVVVNARGRIQMVNSNMAKMFGYSRDEMAGMSIERLIPERIRRRHRDSRRAYLDSPDQRSMGRRRELSGRRKDGREFPVEIGLNPIETPDGTIVLGAVVEMTERRAAENLIASRNQELKTLLHVVAHDLREPVRACRGFSRLALEECAERLGARGTDYLQRISRAASRMQDHLDGILMLSRIRQDRSPREAVAGEVVVQRALERLADRIGDGRAEVRVAPDLPILLAHPVWAVEAVYNLIANALKYTRAGEPAEVEIDGYRPSHASHEGTGIVVRDRGAGVPAESVDEIFEMFRRGGQGADGVGMGLAIVRAVAELHGGLASVRSRSGGGSEFLVSFGARDAL